MQQDIALRRHEYLEKLYESTITSEIIEKKEERHEDDRRKDILRDEFDFA